MKFLDIDCILRSFSFQNLSKFQDIFVKNITRVRMALRVVTSVRATSVSVLLVGKVTNVTKVSVTST